MIAKTLILITVLVLGSASTAYLHEDELMSHMGANMIKSIIYAEWCNDAETLLIVGSDYDNDGRIDVCHFIKNARDAIHVGDAPLIYGKCECIF
jgi:hypothetical protein